MLAAGAAGISISQPALEWPGYFRPASITGSLHCIAIITGEADNSDHRASLCARPSALALGGAPWGAFPHRVSLPSQTLGGVKDVTAKQGVGLPSLGALLPCAFPEGVALCSRHAGSGETEASPTRFVAAAVTPKL